MPESEVRYVGDRAIDGRAVVSVVRPGSQTPHPLKPRLDLWNHSPTGFEWGYGGSGPAQLALAILADCLGYDDLASQLHRQFKWDVIAPLPRDKGWVLTESRVRTAVGLTVN